MPATKEIFARYPNPVFIETGSFHGDGIQMAVDAGFKTVYSIELSPELYGICKVRFDRNDDVFIINGDSGGVLEELLKTILEPVTFWLDGHYCGPGTAQGKQNTPLLQELDAITKHPIKTHTILIDDLRGWTKELRGFDTLDLMKKITSINPYYKFTFEDGFIPQDILVAKC